MRTRVASYRGAALSVLLTFGTVLGDVPAAWAYPWWTVGSTGTVDEADTAIVLLGSTGINQGQVQVTSNAPLPATLNMRYNVVLPPLPQTRMRLEVRYTDNGSGAQVRVHLKEYNISTGVTRVPLTFDSNSFSTIGTQTQQTACSVQNNWDIGWNAYYIDAELIKTSATGTPVLAIVHVLWCDY